LFMFVLVSGLCLSLIWALLCELVHEQAGCSDHAFVPFCQLVHELAGYPVHVCVDLVPV